MKACKKDADCPTPFTCRRNNRCGQALSELAPFKTESPAKVVAAVTTGSLPVSVVESFLATIEHRVLCLRQMRDRDWWDKPKAAAQYGFAAEELENAAEELRAKMESANQRQPEENQQL